jgi:hypothetical protein
MAAAAVETFRLIGSHGFAFDEQYISDLAAQSYDRRYDPDSARRQLTASASSPGGQRRPAAPNRSR